MITLSKCVSGLIVGALTWSVPLASAALDSDYAQGQWPEECEFGDYAYTTGIGSTEGGKAFCASKHKQGIFIKKLAFEGDWQAIRGLTITWTDGTFVELGSMDYRGGKTRYAEIEWDPTAENLSQLQLWGSARGGSEGGIGKVVLATSGGTKMELANDHSDYHADHNADLSGSGVLLGIKGRADYALDQLEFIFSNTKIHDASVSNFELNPSMDELNKIDDDDKRGIKVKSLDVVWHANLFSNDTTQITMSNSRAVALGTVVSKTSSDTHHLEAGFEIETGISLGFQTKVKVSGKYFWEHQKSTTTTDSSLITETKTWSQTAPVKPGKAAKCQAWALEGRQTNLKWTGNMKLTFEDNTSLEYPARGTYSTAQMSEVFTRCDPVPLQDVADGLANGEGFLDSVNGETKDEVLSAIENAQLLPVDDEPPKPVGVKFRY